MIRSIVPHRKPDDVGALDEKRSGGLPPLVRRTPGLPRAEVVEP